MSHFAMPVSLYMSQPVIAVPESASLPEVEHLFSGARISSAPVVNAEGRCTGVLSRTDLLRIGRYEAKSRGKKALLSLPPKRAGEVVKSSVLTVDPDAPVHAAARLLVKHHVHRVFVRDPARDAEGAPPVVTAVFSTKEVLMAIRDKRVQTPIAEHMTEPVFTIPLSAPLALATDRLANAHVSGLVVVEDDGWPIGLFTQTEALESREMPGDTPVEEVMNYAMLCLDVRTQLFRAAGHAHATRARRVLCVEDRKVRGIMTGIDFARAAMH
jgi:CBS domain-containing protein